MRSLAVSHQKLLESTVVGDNSVVDNHKLVVLARCVRVGVEGSRLAVGRPPRVADDRLGSQFLQEEGQRQLRTWTSPERCLWVVTFTSIGRLSVGHQQTGLLAYVQHASSHALIHDSSMVS